MEEGATIQLISEVCHVNHDIQSATLSLMDAPREEIHLQLPKPGILLREAQLSVNHIQLKE